MFSRTDAAADAAAAADGDTIAVASVAADVLRPDNSEAFW